MITGFNHNINYKGGIYHIQTEDSGKDNPHVITHLFVGGNIVESRKMSYADIVKADKLEEVIVDLMQDQHKRMLRDLVSGKFDDKILQRSAGAAHLSGPAPLNVERGQKRTSVMLPAVGTPQATPETARPPPPRPPKAPPPPQPAVTAQPPAAKTLDAPRSIFDQPLPHAAPPVPVTEPVTDEKNVINADSLQKAFETNNKAAINSIFGEDLISEKSLDEVILSYLAEDVHT